MITIDIKPGFYLTVSNEQVYYLYVANNQQIDPKYFAEIKRAIEKIINKKNENN